MKTILTIFLALYTFSGLIYSQGDVCPDGMIGYWKLDEEIVPTIFEDFYGDNFGYSDGDKYPTPQEGIVGNSMFFNGTQEIYIDHDPIFDFDSTESFSIELWVKTEAPPENRSVFIGKYAGAGNMSWWLGMEFPGNAIFSIRDNSDNLAELPSKVNIADNEWHHIVGVYNRSTGLASIYVDGVRDNRVFKRYENDFTADARISIGHHTSSWYFYGWIDETAIYDKVLDETTISNHYTNGLNGRGFCDSVLVAVEDETIVKDYKLYQNYPNPFNPETTIKYALPEAAEISLEIYSSLGEKITILDGGQKEAGVHSVKFNARNLSSGIYFYKFTSGNFVEAKKLLLIK